MKKPALNYASHEEPHEQERSPFSVLLRTPAILMATGGWFCVLPAAMMNDSGRMIEGPIYYTCFWLMLLTGPIGVVTLVTTCALVLMRDDKRWYWLPWIVFGLHLAGTLGLSNFIPMRP